ncbi:hypothetical protein [Urbifossiella limnaea]|uniref:Uncharacterized protein n=1 Tax=Urbifossiella limnaea TaxID=2528023 RepID=A0A517XS88_9BACT|nr:hypothetical protein [Urbifossiella limnaea]QDU20369.1 hypothetical protein ETAA1_23210 [Urbifossiella limnaea]
MKRILLALAVAALSATAASADPGGFAPPAPRGGQQAPGGQMPGGYAMPANHNAPAAAPTTLMGAMSAPAERPPDRYGLLPGLRNLFSLNKGCSTCGECNGKHRGGCPSGGCGPFGHGSYTGGPGVGGHGAPNPYAANQGTLVFPHHPFVRSPRDFFMYEPGR